VNFNHPIYNNLRTFIKPWKSPGYLAFLKILFPDKDLHHGLGSRGALKLTDSLIHPCSRTVHDLAHSDQADFFESNLPTMINNLQNYVTYLETRLKSFENAKEGTLSHDNTREG